MTVPPITPRRAETQNRLLDAATVVFAERGIHASTVEEICDRAGYTRGAFYSNFATRNELVLALMDRAAHDDMIGLSGLVTNGEPGTLTGTREQILTGALKSFLAARNTQRAWVLGQAEIQLHAVREPELGATYREFRQASLTNVVAAMRLVQETFSLTFAFPIEAAIEIIDPIFRSCMLDAFTLPEAQQIDDLKELDPDLVVSAMEPLMNFLTSWVTGIRGAADG